MQRVWLTAVVIVAFGCLSKGQTLSLPTRQAGAISGGDFSRAVTSLSQNEREKAILAEVLSGNVPAFLRGFRPVTITNVVDGRTNLATFFVAPDYLAVGSDTDYFLTPMTPMTASLIADRSGCTLPTRKMVDAIYAAAEIKLEPIPIPPSAAMTSLPVFLQHNDFVRTQRVAALELHPLGALVAGHKKDVVTTPRLTTNVDKVAIYGWHQTNSRPIQPLYLGHTAEWVDYSHGIRLVQQRMNLNGETTTVSRVLCDPQLARLLSDEGVITNSSYQTTPSTALTLKKPSPTWNSIERRPSGHFEEKIAEFTFEPEVRIQINTPAVADLSTKPVLLILYALPNGNTIEQTVGKKLRPGDDWHFDIQHIGAQTRFLREAITNRTMVIAYLETGTKSWPAWRRKHGDELIPEIIARIKGAIPSNRIDIVLTGHSGGGSFTLGYINSQTKIPDEVQRIAFLDSNYAYETTNHLTKLTEWLKSSSQHALCVLAYHDSVALLDGKTFVSERGGTWGRSHAMLTDLGTQFPFTNQTNANGLQIHAALGGRLQLLMKENPDKKILHTVQVERNGFIHAMLLGTPLERKGYDYLGERAYSNWIESE